MAGPRSGSFDRQEVEALFRRFGPLVRRRARGILGNDAEAEDAVQDVFVKVLSALDEFRGDSQPSTWLYRITTNLCLNRLRDGKRHRGRLDEIAVNRADASQAAISRPDAQADQRLTLRALLRDVPEDLAEAAVYYHVDEMDQEEIAALTGVARRTVGYRLERFREEAQARLGAPDSTAAKGGPGGRKPGIEPEK